MANIQISNAAKPVAATCNKYVIEYLGTQSSHVGIIEYIDCDGNAKTFTLESSTVNANPGAEFHICGRQIISKNLYAEYFMRGYCTVSPVTIISQQPSIDGGTGEIRIENANPSVSYRIRATATFNGTADSIEFSNLGLIFVDEIHQTRLGSVFTVPSGTTKIGSYSFIGTGARCTLELLDSSNNVVSSTTFYN